jgi:GH35 family endo-1,4-beta-xylanase
MLQLINSLSQTADIYTDTSITIERNNPLFNEEDQLFADITYGFKLPLTANNREFIKNGHLIEAGNDVYEQSAQLFVDGTPFHAGLLTYKISNQDIDAVLKVNFGAIAEKTKAVKISEIYTGDALYAPYTKDLMNAACNNPEDYPYSFFPVYNEAWNTNELETDFVVNHWDHANQTFNITDYSKATCPWFKLKYLLIKTMEYLGFEVDGDYLTDPASEEVFVYTRLISAPYLNGCFTYLPQDLTVYDFLRLVKERFRISCNFDMVTGKVNIQSPHAALNTSDVQDVREYVTSIDEISISEAKGYSIILKPDEGDELFIDQTSTADETIYSPTNRLIIGNREKEIEMESSTLKTRVLTDYTMPATKQDLYFTSNKSSTFPLRFLKYQGMQSVAGGKVFPQGMPLELSLDDATWYKFLNESKVIKLKINMPAYELARLKVYQRIAFLSEQGNYTIALLEKLSYNLTSANSCYINASIQCRAMVNAYSSDAQVIEYSVFEEQEDDDPTGLILPSYKAYFEGTTLPYIDVEIRYSRNVSSPKRSDSVKFTERILTSTDRFGTGGSVVTTRLVLMDNCELRVLTGTPKYMIYGGVKFDFTQGAGYSYINMYTLPRYGYDGQPVWIIFDGAVSSLPNGNVADTPPDSPPVTPPQPTTLSSKFSFSTGVAIKPTLMASRPVYKAIAKKDFDRWSPENDMKMGRIVQNDGTLDWTDPDAFMDLCKANGKRAMLHCVMWANEMPQYLLDQIGVWTEAQWATWLAGYVDAYLSRYVNDPRWIGIAEMVDLVNEPFSDSGVEKYSYWDQVLPNFIQVAFQAAQPYKDQIKLGINEFSCEYANSRVDGLIAMRNSLAAQGIVMHYVGSQMHTVVRLNMSTYRTNMKKLSDAGIMVHLSELDVTLKRGLDNTDQWTGIPATDLFNTRVDLQNMHRDFQVNIYTGYNSSVAPAMQLGITGWSVGFRDNSKNAPPNDFSDFPVLYDYAYNPTPAYNALLAVAL